MNTERKLLLDFLICRTLNPIQLFYVSILTPITDIVTNHLYRVFKTKYQIVLVHFWFFYGNVNVDFVKEQPAL